MLVLSRRPGEAIVIAGNITIQVLDMEYDRVKLGVDAPPDVLVLRSELLGERRAPARPEPPYEPRPTAPHLPHHLSSAPTYPTRRPRSIQRLPRPPRWSPDRS